MESKHYNKTNEITKTVISDQYDHIQELNTKSVWQNLN